MRKMLILASMLIAFSPNPLGAAEQRTFTIQEPFGLAWGPDRVTYAVEFPKGTVTPE